MPERHQALVEVRAVRGEDLDAKLDGAGATRYVSAGQGLWTFAYRGDGATTVFVLNPTETARDVALRGELCAAAGPWRELVGQREGGGGLAGAAAALGGTLGPKQVWVLRIG